MKLKSLFKTFGVVAVVSLISAGAYMLYFYTIGVPKTQARTFYNKAIEDLNAGERNKAVEDLQTALSYWHEGYIQDKLNEVQQ